MVDTLERPGKIRRNVTLDPDADAWLNTRENASATLNGMIHEAIASEARLAAFDDLLEDLAAQYGDPDPTEVAKFVALLGGAR